MNSRNRQQNPGVVCKLHFEKAYDMGDYDFLQYMLARLGFGEKWRSWIRSCVT